MTLISSSKFMMQTLVLALGLPDSCVVNQRVPKKLLLENGASKAADKRLITDAIAEIQWAATLKPNTIGVPAYSDERRDYSEIAVLTVILRGNIKTASQSRLAELIHRAVPYPLLLLLNEESGLNVSLVHKRWAQNETEKVVLDGELISVTIRSAPSKTETMKFSILTEAASIPEVDNDFLASLRVTNQPQTTLLALYQGWIHCVEALLAARLTGSYQTPTTAEQATARQKSLADCERLEAEVSRLRAQATKEKQIARQVELNLALKRVQTELVAARQQL